MKRSLADARLLSTSEAQPETSAFEKLYRSYFPKLKAGLRATYGVGPPDPEDIAQTAFAKLRERMCETVIDDPESYVWIAARNLLRTEKRAEAVKRANTDEVLRRFFAEKCDTFDPERVFTAREQVELVNNALSAMPERRRRIFLLTRVHGLTLEEAGKRCGVSRTAAIRHVSIATLQLAKVLDAH